MNEKLNNLETMRALRLHAVGDARLESMPSPQVKPGMARVRVGYCGVCGSDLPRVFEKGTYHFPTVCGHEMAGVVDAVGEGVTRFAPGDAVAVFPLIWCGRCPSCESGQYAQCREYDYLGSRSDGGFAEYVIAPEQNLLPVPAGVSLEEAAMTEPASVALHALRRAGGASVGETVAIFGAGPIGLMLAQWASSMGAEKVILFDIVPEKIAMAQSLGFPLSFDSRSVDAVRKVDELTGGAGADVGIEAAGCPPTTIQAIRAAGRGGRVCLMGNPSADVTLPKELISQMLRREIQIVGTWNSVYSWTGNHNDWTDSLSAMASGKLRLRPLITHIASLDEAFETLKKMRDRSEFFAKTLIKP